VSALTYCTTMTTCPSGLSVTVYPNGQAVRRKVETVGPWEGVCLGKWVGKRRDWFFEQVKNCLLGGVSKWLRQSFKLVPGSIWEPEDPVTH